MAHKTIERSFAALGKPVLHSFRAARVPGRVLWCNFESARELGFAVPRSAHLDQRLERELVAAFSLRAQESGTVTLYADRYFGSGMGDHQGSARGGFVLPWGAFVKGIGRTPLAGAGNRRHSSGDCPLPQCIFEALWGELDAHLFSAGSTRVIAIIDQGRVAMVDGKRCHQAVVARVGVPFRPAHLVRRLDEDVSDLPSLLLRLAKLRGVDATRGGQPDFAGTMRHILRLHARTAAEQIRWRVLHGSISTSNVGLFGEMIDLYTQSTQARTAPISVVRSGRSLGTSFGGEHVSRAQELRLAYLTILDGLSREQRIALGADELDCERELQAFYLEELDEQLLQASGLPTALAHVVKTEHPDLVRRYAQILCELMAMRNPGSTDARIRTRDDIGVVDVFAVLQGLPRIFFAAPHTDHRHAVVALAEIVATGTRAKGTRARVQRHLGDLTALYPELMRAVRQHAHLHKGGWRSLRRAIVERAELENRPLPEFYRGPLLAEIAELTRVSRSGEDIDAQALQSFIDARLVRMPRRFAEGR